MLKVLEIRLALITFLTGLALAAVFTLLVLRLRSGLELEIRDKMVSRAASILQPVAQRQFERQLDLSGTAQPVSNVLVAGLLASAHQEDMLSMAIFDANGATLEKVPANQPLVELPLEDFVRLGDGGTISRFKEDYVFGGLRTPVLEVSLPITARNAERPVGFVSYQLDARQLDTELTVITNRLKRQTGATLALGLLSITVVVAAAYFGLSRARYVIEERNARLLRAELELDLAARTSAMGQVSSHLMHGMQGAIAGLRSAVVSGQAPDWEAVSDYTTRLQTMTHEALSVLGDLRNQASYTLSGEEIARSIRERNEPVALEKKVHFDMEASFDGLLDNHRGNILCLIADNLIHNALQASPAGSRVQVSLSQSGDQVLLRVSDQGGGLPESVRMRLFQPGVSTKPGGTGLGLALSRLLARQIAGDLCLASTGLSGTCFELKIPL